MCANTWSYDVCMILYVVRRSSLASLRVHPRRSQGLKIATTSWVNIETTAPNPHLLPTGIGSTGRTRTASFLEPPIPTHNAPILGVLLFSDTLFSSVWAATRQKSADKSVCDCDSPTRERTTSPKKKTLALRGSFCMYLYVSKHGAQPTKIRTFHVLVGVDRNRWCHCYRCRVDPFHVHAGWSMGHSSHKKFLRDKCSFERSNLCLPARVSICQIDPWCRILHSSNWWWTWGFTMNY